MIGKYILPWFGGTPAVWSTVMLFFQVLLTGGYAYAQPGDTYRFYEINPFIIQLAQGEGDYLSLKHPSAPEYMKVRIKC